MKSQAAFIPQTSLIRESKTILSIARCEAILSKKTSLPLYVYNYLAKVQKDKGLSKWEIAALVHIYNGYFSTNEENSWVPIPSTAIDKLSSSNAKNFRSALNELVKKELVEQYIYDSDNNWTYDWQRGKCRQSG